jgi:anthranilate phosphoribosyltransferase
VRRVTIQEAIGRLVEGGELAEEDVEDVLGAMMRGEATPAQMAGFLVAMRLRGEGPEILAGAARAMRAAATPVPVAVRPLVDTCGTGGDGQGTFNVSTAAALVVAGAGQAVAKHGNRAASGRTGGADVLEELGVRIDLGPQEAARLLEEVGMAFLFAPVYHPSMRHVAPVRRELGIRTLMNLLGPLTNPAGADRQVVGVSRAEHVPALAEALLRLGTRRALVVHDRAGTDEITTAAPADVVEVRDGQLVPGVVDPQELGLPRAPLDHLRVRDARESARLVEDVLKGERGPARDTVLLNAAAALYVSDRVEDLREGIQLAARSIDAGWAWDKLAQLRAWAPRERNVVG